MLRLTEGELVFDFPTGASAHRFDGAEHGLSHCMSAVDFVVELTDRILFIEIKDPDNSAATAERRRFFAQELESGVLVHKLTRKLRDSLLYRWAQERLDKNLYYVVLIEFGTLSAPDYLWLTDRLRQQLPTVKVPTSWSRPLVQQVVVLNMKTWNAVGAYGTIRRVTVAGP